MILVTGATGFVGRALITSLLDNQTQVNAIVRQQTLELPVEVKQYEVADLGDLSSTETQEAIKNSLQNVEVVIHTAARVHMMQDASVDPLLDFRKVNRDATLTLANMAVDSGVKRFVFNSSIKVNGE
ncbi:MAG: NAD-dependent epimerase/dehydratase family protein, partial [Thiomicrorhabdus sp.]|nr:NAD-dependent epimerase/dehydratase family protein [Thiomicrorhabdus sp.]